MISIVLGTFFGDEGKGQTVHNLCNKYIGKRESVLVVRFSGGHQVGHTVKHGDMMHTFSNFGSGTLLEVPTYWSEYCTVDPITSMLEGADLAKMGVHPIVQYHPHCQVVIPFDVYSQVNNEENLRHGTVGTGFKACLDRVKAGYSLTVVDCMNPYILREKLNAIVDNYYNMSSKYPSIDLDNWCRLAHAYFLHTGTVNEDCLLNYDNLVFEGSQGILLDQRFGIMPYCTPSNTTSQNAYELLRKAGIRKEIQTCYVTRPYITRHGNGPFPSGMSVRDVDDPNNKFNDFQKTLRAIDFDKDLFAHSVRINRSFKVPYRNERTEKLYVSHWDEASDAEREMLANLWMSIQPMIFDKLV